ncbi:hypothetical protein FGO68_gene13378 [Halteria grandinella]|uniref:Uncharacterized protein n=1 Tax=Halteria grandinella TaxID=5974 RepID=A0A8J8T7X5_HALGN|nr:hypothetical protein FGO68_gene13378 [Halteria grandinella]
MSRLSGILIEYIKSDEYEEMPDLEKRERSRNSKGVWYFTRDYLIQYTLFLHGLFFEQRGIEVMTQKTQAEYARKYYLLSLTNSNVYEIETSLIKRTIKRVMKIQVRGSLTWKYRLQLVLSKFYVKYRSVQVIMEQCNEAPYAHDILISFVKRSIFERLRDHDYFSFISMRSGSKPFLAIPLDLKHCNYKMKQKTLNEFNFSSKMDPPSPYSSRDLSLSLLSCIQAAGDLPKVQLYVDSIPTQARQDWIVAIVGPQKQSMRGIDGLLGRHGIPNIVIIGVNITDKDQCERYRELCNKTPEGQFVNLNFNQQADIFFTTQEIKNEGNLNPQYFRALQQVEAALQLFNSQSIPLIYENIDFN